MISGLQKGPYPSTRKRATKVHPNRLLYVSVNVALGDVHWRNVDRSLATCGGQIALKAINTTHSKKNIFKSSIFLYSTEVKTCYQRLAQRSISL